jgi:hypothetical protein
VSCVEPDHNLMKKIILLLAIAIAAPLVAQSVCAQGVVNDLVITENSSTSLTVTYNGSTSVVTVNNFSPDGWGLNLPFSVSFPPIESRASWFEPEQSGTLPEINTFSGATHLAEVTSEIPFIPSPFAPTPVPDGTTVENLGTDTSNGGTINVTFFDNAATAEQRVPDTGFTLSLLFLSSLGLFSAARLRRRQEDVCALQSKRAQ